MTSLSPPGRLTMDPHGTPSCPVIPGEKTDAVGSYFELPIRQPSDDDATVASNSQEVIPSLSPSDGGDSALSGNETVPLTPSHTPYASSTLPASGNADQDILLLHSEGMIELVEAELTAYSGMSPERFRDFKSDLQAAIRKRHVTSGSGTELSRSQALQRSLTASPINTGGFDTVEAVLKWNPAKFRQDCPDSQFYIDRYVEATDSLVRSELWSEQNEHIHESLSSHH